MVWLSVTYVLLFSVSAIVLSALAFYVLRRRNTPRRIAGVVLLLTNAAWALGMVLRHTRSLALTIQLASLIGLVIVGFGTSTPELLVSVKAALGGAPEIALGNAVGSNIANVLLIVGLASVITPILGWERTAVREALVAALAAGQAAGGDRRGQQSAAVLVVRPEGGYGGFAAPESGHHHARRFLG